MKLSEAIRLGAMLKRQGRGSRSFSGTDDETCALGAALGAIGRLGGSLLDIRTLWPWSAEPMRLQCPARSHADWDLCDKTYPRDLIWHLNDRHRWTRERIADWVATVEPAEQPVAETMVGVEAQG